MTQKNQKLEREISVLEGVDWGEGLPPVYFN